MFDVQVLRFPDASEPLPEAVLASIVGYYRRVTTEAYPMNRAVGVVMLLGLAGSAWQLRSTRRRAFASVSLLLIAGAVALAAFRVVPNAMQLGTRADTLARQSELARAICTDHLWCLAAIVLFSCIQVLEGLTMRISPGHRHRSSDHDF
jgi:hypothetical protein